MDSRFDAFTEQERALLAMGLTLWTLDAFAGLVVGPFPAATLARDMPSLRRLMDELAGSFGLAGLDPELMNAALAALDQRAAEEAEHGR